MKDLGEQGQYFGITQTADGTYNIVKTVPINLNGHTLPWPLFSDTVVSKTSLQKHFADDGPLQVPDILHTLLAPEGLENPFGGIPYENAQGIDTAKFPSDFCQESDIRRPSCT
jgi:hypothetical protein